MFLDPKAKTLLEMVYRVGAPKFHQLSVAQARRSMEKLQYAFQPDPPAVAFVLEVPITRVGRHEGVLLARAYRPIGAAQGKVLPLLLFFHGGGWCLGSVDTHDVFCRELCNAAGVMVLSVDYRLAPEDPFPAAVDDAWLAYRWALEHAAEIGADPACLLLGGDSAGGTLCLATALWVRDAELPSPRLQCLIYPSTEIYSDRPSRETYASGYFLDRETLEWFFERYLPHPGDALDWRASPLLADSLAGVAPVCLVTAGCDPLLDDCLALAEALESSGVKVQHHHYAGMVHGYATLGKHFSQGSDTVRVLATAIQAAAGVATMAR